VPEVTATEKEAGGGSTARRGVRLADTSGKCKDYESPFPTQLIPSPSVTWVGKQGVQDQSHTVPLTFYDLSARSGMT